MGLIASAVTATLLAISTSSLHFCLLQLSQLFECINFMYKWLMLDLTECIIASKHLNFSYELHISSYIARYLTIY